MYNKDFINTQCNSALFATSIKSGFVETQEMLFVHFQIVGLGKL